MRRAILIAEERGPLLIKILPMDKSISDGDVLELMAYPGVPLDEISPWVIVFRS